MINDNFEKAWDGYFNFILTVLKHKEIIVMQWSLQEILWKFGNYIIHLFI